MICFYQPHHGSPRNMTSPQNVCKELLRDASAAPRPTFMVTGLVRGGVARAADEGADCQCAPLPSC